MKADQVTNEKVLGVSQHPRGITECLAESSACAYSKLDLQMRKEYAGLEHNGRTVIDWKHWQQV